MRSVRLLLLSVLAFAPREAMAERAAELHADYNTYAAGLDVAHVQAAFALGASAYEMRLAYRTTGLAGLFYHGHQYNTVQGTWQAGRPAPREFYGVGEWRGMNRVTVIDYLHGQPTIRDLLPPNTQEREPVPPELQTNSMDTLSALALLMRRVEETGRCEADVHTYDGRRATEIEAHSIREEMLPHTARSSFSGVALRCDFQGRMLAGFRFGDEDPADRKPLHGSAWFAAALTGEPPLPVRMQFETRWFGDAIMYLTGAAPGAAPGAGPAAAPGATPAAAPPKGGPGHALTRPVHTGVGEPDARYQCPRWGCPSCTARKRRASAP